MSVISLARKGEQFPVAPRGGTDIATKVQKYCAAQTNDLNGRHGENVYDECTEVVNGMMPMKYAADPRF
ncbi:unnamed protein product [Heligmosomoides polygyrus]|uniref:CHCH domain-containing protein n=1 Tax=Heligmosomoides polygyrus TaxID=6339 RepID=A0A183FBI3_HELPZ|nr:unnamed protein product [Heligmosomoides polygyrus]